MMRFLITMLLFVVCATCVRAEIGVSLARQGGEPFSETNAVKLETQRQTSSDGVETVRCRLVSERDIPIFLRLEAHLPLTGAMTHLFDGRDSHLLNTTRTNAFLMGYFPMAAAWGEEGRAVAFSIGAEEHDSYVDFRSSRHGLTISVRVALLKKGGIYETRFHSFTFNPKYGERDAFACYYTLYPRCFSRNPDVDPRIYGISAQYASWRRADPETCRFIRAGWDWCIGSARTWGDPLDLEQPHGPRNTAYSWDEEISYTDRNGKSHKYRNGSISQDKFDRIRDERLAFGRYCGVANAYYMMALANISNEIAGRYPDSVAVGKTFSNNDYLYSTKVFTFPECSWGRELRRQLKALASKADISAVAFDVSRPRPVYRGERLSAMSNVSWDEHGPCVVRGVGSAKLFDDMHTLKLGHSPYRLGMIINSGVGHMSDVFHADCLMCEAAPWDAEKPFPLKYRLAVGEKGLTLWEGFSLRDFDPNVHQWEKSDRHRLINELAHFAVHASFRTGASLPSGFLCEYTSLMARAYERMNDVGWKPVPGAKVSGEGWELARYGRGVCSYLAVNNLQREVRRAQVEVFPVEIDRERAGGTSNSGLLYAPFFGGEATSYFRNGRQTLSFDVGLQLANVLEAVGRMHGEGAVSVEWKDRGGALALAVKSVDFSGGVAFRDSFETYVREGGERVQMKPGEELVVIYRDVWIDELLAKIRVASDFGEIRYADDLDSRDMAERLAFFLKAASGKAPVLRLDSALRPLTLSVGGMSVSAADRFAFSVRVRRFIDFLNRERFPDYGPRPPMDPSDRAFCAFMRM